MNIIKKIIPFKIKRNIKEHLGVPSLHWTLQNLKKKKFYPKSVIDIGAYEGIWTLDFLEVFPNATVFMVEAQNNKADILKKIANTHSNIDYAIALLSSQEGVPKLFLENETASEVIKVARDGEKIHTILSETLDTLLDIRGIESPDFLKLDVQGHELEVLKGATKALNHAEVCLLEVLLIDLGSKTPLLAEVISFMDEKNFQAYDISQFMRRPYDKALLQIDLIFVKKDSKIIESKRWR